MKKHVVLKAKGEVQKVGYRDFVQTVARNLGIVGYVENLRDGSVQIVCESEESAIEGFTKAIKVKKDFIDVEDVSVVETSDPTGEFEYFDIKYGSIEEELGDRMGAGILYIATTREEVKHVGEKVEGVSSDIQAMHIDMNTRFDTLDEKYGAITQQMNVLTEELQKSTQSLVTLTEKIGALIDQKLAE